jgi:hypothetical protein
MVRFGWEALRVSNTRMTSVVFPTPCEHQKPKP